MSPRKRRRLRQELDAAQADGEAGHLAPFPFHRATMRRFHVGVYFAALRVVAEHPGAPIAMTTISYLEPILRMGKSHG